MAIQGLGNYAPPEYRIRQNIKIKVSKIEKKSQFFDRDTSIGSSTMQSTEHERAEYISLIRNRIKKGFYNSDAVLEDLSHGFAEALDESV